VWRLATILLGKGVGPGLRYCDLVSSIKKLDTRYLISRSKDKYRFSTKAKRVRSLAYERGGRN
jgi:hypothetical protein